MCPVERSADKSAELDGRGGNDHTRESAVDIIQRQTCWPFHLAGDWGHGVFHRLSWLSSRFLALLELPFRSVHELPLTSAQFQSVIEAECRNTPHSSQVDALAVEQILNTVIEESTVLEHLSDAVAQVFTVLESLCSNRPTETVLCISSALVSCIVLFLHLQGMQSKDTVGDRSRCACKNVLQDVQHPCGN